MTPLTETDYREALRAANAIISQQADEMAELQRRLDHRHQALRIMRTSPSIAGCMSGVSIKAVMPFIDAALSDEPLKPHLTCGAEGETNPIERLEHELAVAFANREEVDNLLCAQREETTRLQRELDKRQDMPALLLECRDALPAISLTSARLHNVSLTLADRIEAALAPWEVKS